uniref:Crumbs homolog 3b n=1 Tax=Cyclopterus lumpus TaxID=8103 RepID=A0A8C2XMG9_CYCLU
KRGRIISSLLLRGDLFILAWRQITRVCSLPFCVRLPRQLPVTMATQVLITPTVSVFVSTVLSLLSLALLLLLCVIRKKRRLEGTYRPSAEERKQVGSPGSEKPGLPLPLPKEERLI